MPIVCASTLSRPRCAMPMTTSCAPASAASSIVSSSIGIITSSPSSENCFWPRNRLRRKRSIPSTSHRRRKSAFFSSAVERLPVAARTRSPGAARRAAGGRRGARARRRSCRSTSRRAAAGRRRASRRGRARAAPTAGIRACSSGVSFGSRRSGSSDGSPTGSEPSGSSRAARWPCVRCALTSAIAAATPPSSRVVGRRRRRAGAAAALLRVRRRRSARGRCRRSRQLLEQPGDPGVRRDERGIPALEERAPFRRDRLRVLEVVVEQRARVAGVQAVDVVRAHPCVVPGARRVSFR